jgi:D-threo-aldose 1-dehydrogenase
MIELPTGRTTQLGFGTSALHGGVLDRRASLRVLDAAHHAGIRHFDTAPLYGLGQAEGVLGEFLARHRSGVTISSKYGLPRPPARALVSLARTVLRPLIAVAPRLKPMLLRAYAGGRASRPPAHAASAPAPSRFSAAGMRASLEESLRNLRVDHIHVFLLHEAEATDLTEELRAALERARREGKIGTWGFGSARPRVQAALQSGADLPVAQFDWNPLEPAPPRFAAGTLVILNRWMGYALQAVAALPAPERLRVAQAWGIDPADRQLLVRFLAASVRRVNPAGIALFSSKREAHIREVAQAMEAASSATSD